MTLIWMCIAWILGIFIGSYTNLPMGILIVGVLPLAMLPFLQQYSPKLILASVCLLLCAGGVLRTQSNAAQLNSEGLQFYNDSAIVQIEGIIDSDPDMRDTSMSFQFSARRIISNDKTESVSGKAMVFTGKYPEYRYGDMIRISGTPKTPQSFSDFDYKGYLNEKGIRSVISYPKIILVERDRGTKPLSLVYELRRNLSHSLSLALPEPQNALAQGILLGLRSTIPQQLKDAFSRTGTTHILAISGLNLSIFIGICLAIGIWIFGRQRSTYIWLGLTITWIYTLISGMNAPVIRSALMISLFLLAELLGRQRQSLSALIFAAAIMTAFDPVVLYDVSFQLSFLAMTGLILISPGLIQWGRTSRGRTIRHENVMRSTLHLCTDSIAVTISALATTWPLIAYYFGIFSLVGIPATFFASLALPGIIITAALIGMAGLAVPPLATILGWIAWLFLSYFMLVIQAFNALPVSSIPVPAQIWYIWAYYGILIIAMLTIRYRHYTLQVISRCSDILKQAIDRISAFILKIPKKWILYPFVGATFLIWIVIINTPDDRLHVSILDVGQGDAILIQLPGRHNILIDGGPSPQKLKTELSKKLPFWDRNIDIIFVTQPQADHITGIIDILKNYNVRQVIEANISYESTVYSEYLQTIKTKQIQHQTLCNGWEIDFGTGITLEIVHPPQTLMSRTNNYTDNNDLVMRLGWKDVSFLFTGDIGYEAERYLLDQRIAVRSTVLKVAHHGSNTSSSSEFLSAVNPSVAVISAGANNKFGHPTPEILERLKQMIGNPNIFITAENGTIELVTDGSRLWVNYATNGGNVP